MRRRARDLVVWAPAVVLGIHAALVAHAVAVLGHWPAQYRDREPHEMGALFAAHASLASLGVYLLLASPLAFVALAIANRAPAPARFRLQEAVVFAAPFAIWCASVLLVTRISVFYGWLWD